MNLLVVLAAGALIWAIANGKIKKQDSRQMAALALGGAGLFMLWRGQHLAAIALLSAGAALWPWIRKTTAPSSQMSDREARAILGVPDNADSAMIESAYRRLIVRAHPDGGGTEELARQINLARDTLLSSKES